MIFSLKFVIIFIENIERRRKCLWKKINLFFHVDGSARPNPGPGGFGIVTTLNDKVIDTYSKQSQEQTTNNREELKAILSVFLRYGTKNAKEVPIVYSDSVYCVNIFNDWMFSWANNNWIKKTGGEPENLDLIKVYYSFYQKGYRIDLRKIKGHAGHKFNEMADKLAKGEYKKSE